MEEFSFKKTVPAEHEKKLKDDVYQIEDYEKDYKVIHYLNDKDKKIMKERKKKQITNQYKETAISWVVDKIEKIDKPIENKNEFIDDLMEYIDKSLKTIVSAAVICTAPTILYRDGDDDCLGKIFEKYNIVINGYIFSVIINVKGVVVHDGFLGTTEKII